MSKTASELGEAGKDVVQTAAEIAVHENPSKSFKRSSPRGERIKLLSYKVREHSKRRGSRTRRLAGGKRLARAGDRQRGQWRDRHSRVLALCLKLSDERRVLRRGQSLPQHRQWALVIPA